MIPKPFACSLRVWSKIHASKDGLLIGSACVVYGGNSIGCPQGHRRQKAFFVVICLNQIRGHATNAHTSQAAWPIYTVKSGLLYSNTNMPCPAAAVSLLKEKAGLHKSYQRPDLDVNRKKPSRNNLGSVY